MLTEIRWQKEQELMQSVFPEFRPFTRSRTFGFEGYLRGPRSATIYRVTLEADQETYPQCPPRVLIKPRIGIHWIGDEQRRRLCVERDWRPARSTFANTLLVTVRYLHEHDPAPGAVMESDGQREDRRDGREAGTNPNTPASCAAVPYYWRRHRR
jgi:hypothetical protein